MRRWFPAIVVAAAIGACGGPSTATSSRSPEPAASPEPAPTSGGVPTSVEEDLPPPALPFEAMIPEGADLTGRWFADTDGDVTVLLSWVEPGSDFARLPRGYAVWRRFGSAPHWRAELVERHQAEDAVQEIQIATTDMSGDGSDDALVFEGVGGSGGCGRWSLIDLVRVRRIYGKRLCDARIDPGPFEAPGLVITRSVYREGDAHCCPSAMRETVLTWTGSGWRVTSNRVVVP